MLFQSTHAYERATRRASVCAHQTRFNPRTPTSVRQAAEALGEYVHQFQSTHAYERATTLLGATIDGKYVFQSTHAYERAT